MEKQWLRDVVIRYPWLADYEPLLRQALLPQKLYSQQVVEEGQQFLGEIHLTALGDSCRQQLERLLDEPFPARFGRGSGRGQGWVSVERCDCDGKHLSNVHSRGEQFVDAGQHPLLAVTLLSDAIFTDSYLRDLTMPEITHLAGTGIDISQWETTPSISFADTRWVCGFQGHPLRLPRIPRIAVKAGSVFLFKACHPHASPQYPAGDGSVRIGDRIAEGFGNAVLWHPFHLDFVPTNRKTEEHL